MVKRATTDVLRNSDLNPHGCGGLRQKNRFLEDELSNPGGHVLERLGPVGHLGRRERDFQLGRAAGNQFLQVVAIAVEF